MVNKFENALNRVKNIPEQFFEGEEDVSLHWNEFIRRFYDFADQTSFDLKDYSFDIEETFGQTLPDKTHRLIDEAISTSQKNTNHFERLILKQYLIWVSMACELNEYTLKNIELFEPVIRIMEAGSRISLTTRSTILLGAYTYAIRGICHRRWAAQEPIDIDAIPLKKQNGEKDSLQLHT